MATKFVKNNLQKKVLKMTKCPFEERRQLARVVIPSQPKVTDEYILKKIKTLARNIMPITNIGAKLGLSRDIWFQNLKLNSQLFMTILESEIDEYFTREKKYQAIYDAYIGHYPLNFAGNEVNITMHKYHATKEHWAMFQHRFDKYSTTARVIKIEENKDSCSFLKDIIEIEETRNSSIFQKIRRKIIERLDKECAVEKKRAQSDLSYRPEHLLSIHTTLKKELDK